MDVAETALSPLSLDLTLVTTAVVGAAVAAPVAATHAGIADVAAALAAAVGAANVNVVIVNTASVYTNMSAASLSHV